MQATNFRISILVKKKILTGASCSRKQGLKICLPQKNLKYHHFEIGDSEESCKGEWQQHKRCLQRYFGKTGGGDAFVNSFLRMSSLGEDIYLILFEVKIHHSFFVHLDLLR